MMHEYFIGFRFHFAAALLGMLMMLTHQQGAMRLMLSETTASMFARLAKSVVPFKAIIDLGPAPV